MIPTNSVRYSTADDLIICIESWRKEKGGCLEWWSLCLPRSVLPMIRPWSPTDGWPAHVKWWINSLFCSACITAFALLYQTVLISTQGFSHFYSPSNCVVTLWRTAACKNNLNCLQFSLTVTVRLEWSSGKRLQKGKTRSVSIVKLIRSFLFCIFQNAMFILRETHKSLTMKGNSYCEKAWNSKVYKFLHFRISVTETQGISIFFKDLRIW